MSDTREAVALPAHLSARTLLGRTSLIILGCLAAVVVSIVIVLPHDVPPLITGLIALLYLGSTIDRNYLVLKGLKSSALIRVSNEEALTLTDEELPVYTVLLPVYDEPSIVANLHQRSRQPRLPQRQAGNPAAGRGRRHATQMALLDANLESMQSRHRSAQHAQDEAKGVQLRHVTARICGASW